MGTCLSSLDGPDDFSQLPCGPLFFHPYIKGSQIVMDESHRVARRVDTFHDGILFSNRPIERYEKVTLKILKEESKWHGGLRVGFTWEDPFLIEPGHLPPFSCPNLVARGKSCAGVLPAEYGAEGTIISFWADSHGCVFGRINQESEASLLLKGVSVTSQIWAVVDVYGKTKAVQLLDPSSIPRNADGLRMQMLTLDLWGESTSQELQKLSPESTSQELQKRCEECSGNECAVCFVYKANAMMLPCHHANFCSCCSLKVLKTSGHCPLCRQKVKKVIKFSVLAESTSLEPWSEDGKDIQPPW